MRKLFNILFIILAVLSVSCTPKLSRAIEVATKTETNARVTEQAIYNTYPVISAETAAARYPITEKEETTNEFTPGNVEEFKEKAREEAERADSLQRYVDTLPVKPECEPEVVARDKVIAALRGQISSLNTQAENLRADVRHTTTKLTQESTAAVEALRLKNEELSAKNKVLNATLQTQAEEIHELENKPNYYKWIFWIAVLLGVIITILRFAIPFRRRL